MSNINIDKTASTSEQIQSLEDAINVQDNSITELLRNVKWLYKYGGSGTGGGSSSGSSSTRAFLMGVIYDGTTVWVTDETMISKDWEPTDGKRTYYITVLTRYTDATLTYKYLYKKSGDSQYRSFTVDDSGLGIIEVPISGNDSIEILIRDSNLNIRSITLKYIVDFITVTPLLLVDSNYKDIISNDNEILMSAYLNIFVKLKYELYHSGNIKYTYTDILGVSTTGEGGTSDTVYLPLCTSAFLNNEDNLGMYIASVKMTYQATGSTLVLDVDIDDLLLSLIPSTLYVQVIPDSGNIYSTSLTLYNKEGTNDFDDSNLNNPYVFISGYRSFRIKVFSGVDDNEPFSNLKCSIYKKEEEILPTLTINSLFYERDESVFSAYIEEEEDYPQEYKLNIELTTKQGTTVNTSYYLYIEASPSDFKWIDDSKNILSANYFKRGNDSNILTSTYSNLEFLNSGEAMAIPLSIDTVSTNSSRELSINIGILYSEINSSNTIIATLTNSKSTIPITIKLNSSNTQQVSIASNTASLYIPRESYESYGDTNGEYHLITLYRRAIKIVGTTTYYEWVTYVDGIIEHAVSSFVTTAAQYETLTFNPTSDNRANFLINHIGIYEFGVDSSHLLNSLNYTGLSDIDIVLYYYKYRNSISTTINTNYAKILNSYSEFNYDYDTSGIRNPYIKLSSNNVNNIASTSGIPCAIVEIPKSSLNVLDTISNTSYGEEDTFIFEGCSVTYRAAGELTAFMEPTVSSNLGDDNVVFDLSLQGSSTKEYRVKNFNLAVRPKNAETSVIPVYSFNYDPTDTSTFIPEQSFTLKADLVDSSHSNNTSLGLFINTYSESFNAGVKNCLTGYPILLFIRDMADDDTDNNYYLLGIYNYNLGRDSLNNLGHSTAPTSFEGTGFIVNGISTNNLKDGFIVAEIQNNSAYWDFSLFDDSILFEGKCYDTDKTTTLEEAGKSNQDTLFMWGDIKFRETLTFTTESIRNSIKDFTKQIATTGGLIFKAINKNFDSTKSYPLTSKLESKSYHIENTVPDYTKQYKRYIIPDDAGNYFGYEVANTYTPEVELPLAILDCIYTQTTEGGDTIYPELNYTSALQYYTICMAFGMVDSVQKNLNIKTWNGGKTWYTAFYDMDTALGIDNSGKYISAFAFSDYWKGENGEITVYRDYWDESDTTNVGFDVPSSYLFSIVKYSEAIRNVTTELSSSALLLTPTSLWSILRGTSGYLRNAKYFIDNFFSKQTSNINEVVWNLNYRYKYMLMESSSSTNFIEKDFAFFHGRRVHYTENWLNKRLRILDAYFNLNNIAYPIDNVNGHESTTYVEHNPTLEPTINNNEDVKILRLIFNGGSGDAIKNNLNISSIVKVNEFSPLIINTTSGTYRYLLDTPGDSYSINAPMNGNLAFSAFGSDSWVYLDSLNCYLVNNLEINIKASLLENLLATKTGVTPTSWVFTAPSAKTISLTSSDYSGPLSIYNANNLTSLDISGTSIALAKTNKTLQLNYFSSLTTLDMSDMTCSSSDIEIVAANSLTSANFNKSIFNSLTINPIVISNFSIDSTAIPTMTLYGDESNNNQSISIVNDLKVTSITVGNFENITISNCPKLTTITVPESSLSLVKSITIIGCSGALLLGSTATIIDLTGFTNLESIKILNCTLITKIILPSKLISLGKQALYGCSSLSSIKGSVLITNAFEVFKGCANLHITNSDFTIAFSSSITSLEGMFSYLNSSLGRMAFNNDDLKKLKTALTTASIVNKITSLKNTFLGCSITAISSFFENTATKEFTSLSDAYHTFGACAITETITANILNIGSTSLTTFNMFWGNNGWSAVITNSWYANMRGGTTFALDAFSNIGSNLKSLDLSYTDVIVSGYGDATNPIPLRTFISKYCPNLTSVNLSFSAVRSNTGATTYVDFASEDELYALPSTLTSLYISDTDSPLLACNFDSAFANLSKLSSIGGFCSITVYKYNDTDSKYTSYYYNDYGTEISLRTNIYTLFDWENIVKLNSSLFLPSTNYSTTDGKFNFLKTITYNDFKSLFSLLVGSTSKVSKLGRVFSNCIITDYDKENSSVYSTSKSSILIDINDILPSSNNTIISSFICTFLNLKPEVSTDYIDFCSTIDGILFFQRFVGCTAYPHTWECARLYNIYDNWFLVNTSKPITDLDNAFNSTIFKIPYCTAYEGVNQYYYNDNPSVWCKTDTSATELEFSNILQLTAPSEEYTGLYIIYPSIFLNTSNANISYMFSSSNLFGTIPSLLFKKADLSTAITVSNIQGLFNNTTIVPLFIKTVYIMEKDSDTSTYPYGRIYKVNKYCYIPNGYNNTVFINSNISYEYAFTGAIVLGSSFTEEYIAKDTLNSLYAEEISELIIDYDDISSAITTDSSGDIYDITTVNLVYVFNTKSLSWEGNYNNILPKLIVKFNTDNSLSYSTGESSTTLLLGWNTPKYIFNYGNTYKEVRKRTHFNVRYSGEDLHLLDLLNSKDGLIIKNATTKISAIGLISDALSSLYCGNIFSPYIAKSTNYELYTTTVVNIPNNINSPSTKYIINISCRDSLGYGFYYGQNTAAAYTLSRDMILPKASSKYFSKFCNVYYNSESKIYYYWKLYNDLIQSGSSFYFTGNSNSANQFIENT